MDSLRRETKKQKPKNKIQLVGKSSTSSCKARHCASGGKANKLSPHNLSKSVHTRIGQEKNYHYSQLFPSDYSPVLIKWYNIIKKG